ncbi:multiple epidermal growth factor-like domains protein 9 [Sagmatias obliquidens]|uniref:multiple epidermal growth factor-like domains protein 9 n=1 Tax=Sagmatias obliquidens TaxID=3371155 RepID=UPI000F43FBA1|nr:multiple epidermal growth factor-like domains protein 9 [Lagenorhynchus obliquidens]
MAMPLSTGLHRGSHPTWKAWCVAFVSAATTELVPTVSTARTCTRTTHGRQQSLGTPMPARPAHSISTYLVLLQNPAGAIPGAASLALMPVISPVVPITANALSLDGTAAVVWEPPSLLLLTVHKPQGPPLVGSGPDFRDSVSLDMPPPCQAPKEPLPLHQGAGCTLWTGSDFARVVDGAGLSLLAPIVPSALKCDIVLHYETQVVLLPQVKGLPGLRSVDPGATGHLQELHKAGCVEAARMSLSSTIPEACARLACSISALFQGGGLECCCHTKGATNAICNPVNGQCPCRAGLAGRCCDHCLYGWWGFPCCQPCACSGAAELCHPLTGVCQDCHGATMDQHCERCLDGYYGDPTLGSGQQCWPCLCPGHPGSGIYHGTSCHVDSTSGRVLCLCASGYAGPRYDRCSLGYFGHPWPGDDPRRSLCQPCQCNNNIDPVIQPPVTPTVDTASTVSTTAMALAVPTAGLASKAVPCTKGAAGMSVC